MNKFLFLLIMYVMVLSQLVITNFFQEEYLSTKEFLLVGTRQFTSFIYQKSNDFVKSSESEKAESLDNGEDVRTTKEYELEKQYERENLKWCNVIYHQNVSCPGYGSVVVPKKVLDEQQQEFLKWCNVIYHQNVSCPKYKR